MTHAPQAEKIQIQQSTNWRSSYDYVVSNKTPLKVLGISNKVEIINRHKNL